MDRQELAMRYVLGDLSEQDELSLAKQYLSEETQFEELEIAEEELIDRHVRGELSARDSRQFKEILGNSPRLRERVEFAKLLARRVSSESPVPSESTPQIIADPAPVPKRRKNKWLSFEGFWGTTTGVAPALRFAFSASVISTLIAITALIFVWARLGAESRRLALEQQQRQQRDQEIQNEKSRNERLQAELEQARRENEQQKNSIAELQQKQEQAGQQAPQFPAIFLLPSTLGRGSGGAQEQTLQVPRDASAVHVNLDVQRGDYASYSASMADTKDNRVVSQGNDLKPFRRKGRKYVRLHVAPHGLTDGLYSVHVDGLTPSGKPESFADFLFRIRLQ